MSKGGPPQLPDPKLLEKLINVQMQDLALKQEQLGLQKQQATQTHELGKLSIDAQAKDRASTRTHRETIQKHRLFFAGFVLLILAFSFAVAIYLNKDQIALEAVKTMGLLLAGGLGGYSIGRHQSKPPSS